MTSIDNTVAILNEAVWAICGPDAGTLVIDRGDGIVLSLESGHHLLDYWSESAYLIDTLVDIATESGLAGYFETETPGAAIWCAD
jgi:hypothetical protein